MSNMSYCRFENTAGDLDDCVEQLRALFGDGEDRPTKIPADNDRERAARVRLVELCLDVAELFDGVLDEADPRAEIKRIIAEQEAAAAELEDDEEGDEE